LDLQITKLTAIITEQKDEFLKVCEINFVLSVYENLPVPIFSKRRKEVNAFKIVLTDQKKESVSKLEGIPLEKMTQYAIVIGGLILIQKLAVQKLPNETPPTVPTAAPKPDESPAPKVDEVVEPEIKK